jgi:hypothetical protein
MKNYTLVLIIGILGSFNLDAQDIFGAFYEGSIQKPIVSNIDSIKSTTYTTSNYEEDKKADTTFVIDGQKVDLFISSKTITKYTEPGTTIEKQYDPNGKYIAEVKIVQDENGRMVENSTSFEDAQMAQFMNSSKVYQYENDKIVSIVDAGKEVMSVTYDEDNTMPKSISVDAGIGQMLLDRSTNEEGFVYHTQIIPVEGPGELMEMLKKKLLESPKLYILYKKEGDLHYYTTIEEDRETEEIIGEEVYVRNDKGLLVESKISKGFNSHNKYVYNDKGEVIETIDVISGETRKNLFDENGNMQRKYEEYSYSEYIYDTRQSAIQEMKFIDSDERVLQEMTTHEIFYKD